MEFLKTSLADAVLIELRKFEDPRGFFARTFCKETFGKAGLVDEFVQTNHSHNVTKGTLRGMHFQKPPHGEVKLVRCVKGAIWDAIIDLRPESSSFGKWEGFELTEGNGRMLYVPVGFAHGFQTLQDDADVTYQVSYPYTPGVEGGVRHDDPAFGIDWPLPVSTISDKDAAWPLVTDMASHLG
jgi:dTDP-4-dehydrorhamnose 3,5-epimerase